VKFSDTLHILFLPVKEKVLQLKENDLQVKENNLKVKENDLRINFAKAAKYLVYVQEPLCVLSIFYEFSV